MFSEASLGFQFVTAPVFLFVSNQIDAATF